MFLILINKYKLGIATRSSEKISKFLESDSFTENQIPEELLIDNQFLKIKEMFISLSKELVELQVIPLGLQSNCWKRIHLSLLWLLIFIFPKALSFFLITSIINFSISSSS